MQIPELVVIGGAAAILFGPSKLPGLGKSLGKTVQAFRVSNLQGTPWQRTMTIKNDHDLSK